MGAFLNVHEGPQSISYKKRPYEEGLMPGITHPPTHPPMSYTQLFPLPPAPLSPPTHPPTHPPTLGMVTSNEPGYYADGQFGIRIESLVVCEVAQTAHRFGDTKYVFSTHPPTHPLILPCFQKKSYYIDSPTHPPTHTQLLLL